MARILILIGAHLCTAPRPQKEAAALAEAGHEVEIAGVWYDDALAARDREILRAAPFRFRPASDFRPLGVAGRLRSAATRLAHRRARERFRSSREFSPLLLGYAAPRLLDVARERRADLTIAHSEAGLWVVDRLLDEGMRVGVDFEDWFSEDLPREARAARPVDEMRRFESRLCRECTYVLATTRAMADAMARDFDAPSPTVLYNVFPQARAPVATGRDRVDDRNVSLHWFSQTVGRGRGLETLFAALGSVESPVEVHLRGNLRPDDRRWLDASVPHGFADRVRVHPVVPGDELPARIAQHDIGLALETNAIRNRDLTATNKLFQYMQAGLAVAATDTAGQREILDGHPDVGSVVPCDDAPALARAIDDLARDAERLAACKEASEKLAEATYCWERHKHVVVDLVQRALAADP